MSDVAPVEAAQDAAAPALAVPSAELVHHAMRELGYDERLVLHRMTVGLGTTHLDIYSFAELVAGIFGTEWNRLHIEASRANLMWVDPATLTAWLRDVIGDVVLADAVAEATEGSENYKSMIEAIYPLFSERTSQYETALMHDDVID